MDQLLEFIYKNGPAGLAVGVTCFAVFIVGLLSGAVQSSREVDTVLAERDKALLERDKRYEEMKLDRDFYKTQVSSLTESLERLTEVLEAGQNRPIRR